MWADVRHELLHKVLALSCKICRRWPHIVSNYIRCNGTSGQQIRWLSVAMVYYASRSKLKLPPGQMLTYTGCRILAIEAAAAFVRQQVSARVSPVSRAIALINRIPILAK